MKISDFVYLKICTTARAISHLAGREVECMGYLLKKKGSALITDFFFPCQNGMEARGGTSDFPHTEIYESGFYVAGMWHSHGSFPLFHSQTDYTHIANKLKSMERENTRLDSWQAYPLKNAVALFNSETMNGFKLMLKCEKQYEIKPKEVFPDGFFSIVVNRDVYARGKQCHAMRFSLRGAELLRAEEKAEIIPALPDETLEEIAEKFSIDGKLLKDAGAYKKMEAICPEAKGDEVYLNCRKGNFVLKCKSESEAKQLQKSIFSIEELEEQEKEQIKSRIPKPPSLEKKLESIFGKKQEALVSQKQYASNDDYLNGSKELHLFYVGKFLAMLPYYTKVEMDSDKAVLDLLAAVAGVFDEAETREEAIKARAIKIREACRRIKVLDKPAKEALKKAEEIVKKGDYSPEEKRKIAARLRILRKKKKANKAMEKEACEKEQCKNA